jgi:hypothetical protein
MPIREKHLSPGFRGAINKTVVVKQYATKTVITPYPDMSAVTASASQQNRRSIFAEAVSYASSVKKDPVLRAAFEAKIPKGVSVYRAALSEYLLLHK